MNAVYLLPCSCGNKVRVDAGQAGAKVSCACGQQLSVPTFRGLKELEVEAAATPAAIVREDSQWSAGRGMLFSFGLLISVIAAGVVCYHTLVYYQMRDGGEPYKQMHLEEMRYGVDHMTGIEVFAEFQQMAKAGLTVDGIPPWSRMSEVRDVSFRWLMGALVVLGVGLVSLFGSLLVRPRRKESR